MLNINASHRLHECGGTILGSRHDGVDYSYCDRCGAFDLTDGERVDLPDGCDPVRNRQAWDDGDLHSPDAQWDDVPPGHIRCEAGEWSGDGDHHTCLRDAAVRVWYVPEYRRDTARTLRSWDGLSLRIVVCPDCAEQMAEHDPEWTSERYWGGR